ncbi:MAG: hypothetical protein COA78_20050 [Blastopirellula sp.]|nr:MAG: hypothetical protein COA78_20050 [Blastopirellula sp.]
MTETIPHEQLEFLETADSFLVFARLWWDGSGIDSGIWWEDRSGCHLKVMRTGEVFEKTNPTILCAKSFKKKQLQSLLSEFKSLGITDLEYQSFRHNTRHCDDWYGIKSDSMDAGFWRSIPGVSHVNPVAEKVLKCFEEKLRNHLGRLSFS